MSTSVRKQTMKALEGEMVTRMPGRPTFKNVNQTRNKLAAIYAETKTTHPNFPYGEQFGYAVAIMKPTAFIAQ